MTETAYSHHRYEWSRQFMSVHHQWSLIGPKGGLSFHIALSVEVGAWPPTAGLETHYARGHAPDYLACKAPSHTECWLLKEPCWHDGTSLYASETLWPMIEPMLASGDHDGIFRLLEAEADRRFAGDEE